MVAHTDRVSAILIHFYMSRYSCSSYFPGITSDNEANVYVLHLGDIQNQLAEPLNPFALRTAKTQWSFGRSEGERVKELCPQQ